MTGATSGLGRSMALTFAKRGAQVAICGRRAEEGAKTVAMIEQSGGRCLFLPCEVSKADDVSLFIQRAVAESGRLVCAVNNAGISGNLRPVAETTDEVWNQVVNINLTGTFLCMRSEIQTMMKIERICIRPALPSISCSQFPFAIPILLSLCMLISPELPYLPFHGMIRRPLFRESS